MIRLGRMRNLGVGRFINRGLNRFGLHILRVRRRRLSQFVLSPELEQETEIAYDMTQYESNDLRRYFLSNNDKTLHKWHHYFEIYDRWFSRFRSKTDLRILEIGVSRGGSLRMWREYFHHDAVIVGIDIDSECKIHESPDTKIFVEIGDQTDLLFLEYVVERYGPYDIIIDDGGHTTVQQITSFNFLYSNALTDDGIYFVEDLHTNYWPLFVDSEPSFIDFARSLVDNLHEPYLDDHLIDYYAEGHPEQRRSMKVSRFCANTRTISFHDSIIVFEKRKRSLPVVELR